MGSNLSCIGQNSNEKKEIPADNVYAEADEPDGSPTPVRSSAHLPPSYDPPSLPSSSGASRPRSEAENKPSNSSSNSSSSSSNNNSRDKPPRTTPLLPPTSKNTNGAAATAVNKGDKPGKPIFHDVNGYAIPFPKSAKTTPPSATVGGKIPPAAAPKDKPGEKNGVAVKVKGHPVAARVKVEDKTIAEEDQIGRRDKEAKNKTVGSDKGAYCNVIIADGRESKSFSNELYEDTDTAAPDMTSPPKVAVKPPANHSKSQSSELNYIQVEFVSQEEVTSKTPRVKMSSSPTQYSDVIIDHGVVRPLT